ncbi:MAG TPA: hypothetical protein VN446_03215 [Candidatus Acidoferrum sp.]|nr:hypothetical protein [Candidatus Acidoferrum sp.]
MFSAKKTSRFCLALCLALSLTVQAAGLTPRIESVKETPDGRYAVEGRMVGDDGEPTGQLYAATYDETGRMTEVGAVTSVGGGVWSYTGGESSGGIDVLKTFALAGTGDGFRPQGGHDAATVVSTMEELAAALEDGGCDNLFLAKDITLNTADPEKIIRFDKAVTVSRDVTLIVPEDYRLELNGGARLAVCGTLVISPTALVAVSGSHTFLDEEENVCRTGASTLTLNGGTVDVEGTLRLFPAGTDVGENYDGGEGGLVTGNGDGGIGALLCSGRIEIPGGYTDEVTGAYNNAGRVEVLGYGLTVAEGGELFNENELVIGQGCVLSGGGAVTNHGRIRNEGGSIAGTLCIDNWRELQSIELYADDGAGHITVIPAAIGGDVVIDNHSNNGWLYGAAQVQTGAALHAALAGYDGGSIEFAGDDALTLGSFDVPFDTRLCTFLPLNLAAAGKVNVYGKLEMHNAFNIPEEGELVVMQSGTLEVRGDGERGLANNGTIHDYGFLYVGASDGSAGYLYNGDDGLITVDESAGLEVAVGSELENDGVIAGAGGVTLVSDGTGAGLLTGDGTQALVKAAIRVFSHGEMLSGLANPAYDVLIVAGGIEIPANLELTKELVVPKDCNLRVLGGVTLTFGANARIVGWVENQGTVTVGTDSEIDILGKFYNNGGEPQAVMIVNGTVDVKPGGMLKNHGELGVPGGGAVEIGGVLAWGGEDAMPVAGTTPGYSVYGDGVILPSSRVANGMDEFNALLNDESCDNVRLGFDMTVLANTLLTKSVSVPGGRRLTVADGATLTLVGAQLDVESGGTLDNEGTVVAANENGNPGRIFISGGAVLDTADGVIEVYGELRFGDYGNTEIHGEGNIFYHYDTTLAYLAKTLAPMLTDYEGYIDGDAGEYTGYADWNILDGESAQEVAFILANMSDRDFLERTYGGDENTYIEPFRSLDYSEILEILAQLWDTVNDPPMPAEVALVGKDAGDPVGTYDYGSGSEFGLLCDAFMQALGNIEVGEAATFTVNAGPQEQVITYRTFREAVTVVWDTESGHSTENIVFEGCSFEKGLVVVNSGERYWVNLVGCELDMVEGKACQVFAKPELMDGDPVYNVTDNAREVILNLFATDGVAALAEGTTFHASCFVPGGSFTLNGVTFYGAADLGGHYEGFFEGKYQLDASEEGVTESFHAGTYTETVTAGGRDISNFHMWDNIRGAVTLDLGGTFENGGSLAIADDVRDDPYEIVAIGTVGDALGENTLEVNLHGNVDISGLTALYANLNADSEAAVRFAPGGAWIAPAVVGDFDTAAIRLGEGDLTGDDYDFTLCRRMRDEHGDEYLDELEDVTLHYDEGSDETFLWGLADTNELLLEVTFGGKTVFWRDLYRAFDRATRLDFAEMLYVVYGGDAVHFTPADDAEGFVAENELMEEVSDTPVTMFEVVTAFAEIANKLDVTLKNYYPGGILARVDYRDGVTYGETFENALLELASAFALGSRVTPYYTWDGELEAEVLAIGFEGGNTLGKSTYDPNGNSEISALFEAFRTACEGSVFVGNSPEIMGATFAGTVSMTQGGSMGNELQFRRCVFTDNGEEAQALDISLNCGVNAGFDACDFSGAAGGFAVNLTRVTPGDLNLEGINLSNIPNGARILTEDVRVQADCEASEGSFTLNEVVITALDFADYDGEGGTFEGGYFAAGIWWDEPEVYPSSPTLGFSGGVAGVSVPGSCTTEFMAFNAGDDCPYDVVLDIAEGWTPNVERVLSLRSWSGHTLRVTGTVAGSGEEEAPLMVELLGATDVAATQFTGKYTLFTGKWNDLSQNHKLGDKRLFIFYDEENDPDQHIGISVHNSAGAIDATDTADVIYGSLNAWHNVIINGFEGIRLTPDGRVYLGEQLTAQAMLGDYAFTLYELQDGTLSEIVWTPDDADPGDRALVPDTALHDPYQVLLHVAYTDPEPGDGDHSYSFNVVWLTGEEEGGERSVSTLQELEDALQDADIYRILIVDDITLAVRDGESESAYMFDKDVEIGEDVTLTVEENVSLNVGGGLIVNGTLSAVGPVYVYGWLDDRGDWDTHIVLEGEGQVYVFIDFQTFAIELYNTYALDYGLSEEAEMDDYASCYAPDYYENAGAADGIRAINFLIENGVIDEAEADNLNGWVKLPYGGAMAMLDGLAAAIEEGLEKAPGSITGYGLEGMEPDNLLYTRATPSTFTALLDSFSEAVGPVTVLGAAEYSVGIQNFRLNYSKNYAADVSVNGVPGESVYFEFRGCTFGGNLTIAAGAHDTVLLIDCEIAGDLTVLDDDGNTDVYFLETVFENPAESTVTVTEKTEDGAENSARIGKDCDTVALHFLPAGVNVVNEDVSVAVSNRGETGAIHINGVEVLGAAYVEGDDDYMVMALTCWQEGTLIPALLVSGRTQVIDAAGDEMGYGIFGLNANVGKGIYAANTRVLPKAGSEVTLVGAEGFRLLVSFDGGETVIDPLIVEGGEDYQVEVPDTEEYTYEIDTGGGFDPVEPVEGVIALPSTDVSMVITYDDGMEVTQVTIYRLACNAD